MRNQSGSAQGLPRRADDVGRLRLEDRLGLGHAADPPGHHHGRRMACVSHRATDRGRSLHVASERPLLVRAHRRHALVAARSRVRVGRPSHLGLLRVLELAPARQRHEVHARLREPDPERDGVRHVAAVLDRLVGEVAAAHAEVGAHRLPHPREDLQRQPCPLLHPAAVAVVPRVSPREERRHRVRVGVVQLDAVEARLSGPTRRRGEQVGQHLRQVTNVGQVRVGHPLALAVAQRLELAGGEHLLALRGLHRHQRLTHGLVVRGIGNRLAVAGRDRQEPPQKLVWVGPPTNPQEIDDLDQQPRLPLAGLAHHVDQLPQSGQEPIVADAQQRPAGDVADARRLHHDRARAPASEAGVPVEHARSDVALLGRAPRHHGGDPRAMPQPAADPVRWAGTTARRGLGRALGQPPSGNG